jgi:6-phosphogluconolactonase
MQQNLVYVGTYTRPGGKSKGIYVFRRDPASGKLEQLHEIEADNPSFVAFDPAKRFLFCVNERKDYEGTHGGAVSSYAIDQTTGNLTFLSKQQTIGGDPCHLCTDPTGRFLFVANHEHGNVATFPIGADGKLEPASDLRQHEGSGPGPTQQGPHAHFVTLDPTGERVMVNDKGIDKVMIYRLDAAGRRLVAADPPFASLHSGAAPRHIAFHPSAKYAYVNGEADMTITAFAYDAATGRLTELHYLSTLPEGASRERVSTAQIVVEPSGRYVYVSNRGHDSIAIFAIDQATGRLTSLGHQSTGGRTPRNFNVDPEGKYLYCGNQNSDQIVTFRIQPDGRLEPTGDAADVGAPVAIIFS